MPDGDPRRCPGADCQDADPQFGIPFRAYSNREFEGLDRLLSDLGGTPRFIAYLRSPPQFFVAKLQQQLKTSSGGVGSEAIRYLEAIEAYEWHYGTAPTLRVFDRTVLTDGDVVADFCATVGLDSPRDAERGPEEANASMSAEAMAVLQSAGRPTRGRTRDETRPQRELRLRVQEIDRVLPGYTRPKLRQGMRDRLVSLSSELPVLRDRYGVTFPDIDYAMIGRDMGGPFPALPVADLVPVDADRLAAFLARMEAPPRVRLKDRLRRLFGNA